MIRPEGPYLDAATARAFRDEFLARVPADARAILDLGGIEFVDSSGCGAILACGRHLSPGGNGPGSLAICGARPPVRSLFSLVRIHKVLDLFNTRDEALRASVPSRHHGSLAS